MAEASLAQISPGSKQWIVTARVARLWHYRGGTDTGNVQHTDLVLLDEHGAAMYAEIAENYVDAFIDLLEEGKVYRFKKFVVSPPKRSFKPVQGRYMIRFTKFTTVSLVDRVPEGFPLYTFSLTPFNNLSSHIGTPEYFTDMCFPTTTYIWTLPVVPALYLLCFVIFFMFYGCSDVIGAITGVSDLTAIRLTAHQEVSSMRTLSLQDSAGRELNLVLWGKCAESFNSAVVYLTGQEEPVVAIFIGIKRHEGERGLSGGSACRYFINEDIPEINVLRARLQENFVPIKKLYIGTSAAIPADGDGQPEEKTVSELIEMDYFDNENVRFTSTVTVTRLSPDQTWWFSACNNCNKLAMVRGCQFICGGTRCDSVEAEPKYKICVMGSDDTAEAEFVLFGRVGQSIIRKPIMSILAAGHSRHAPVVEIVQAAQRRNEVPPDIAKIVSQKFKFEVSVSEKSFTADRPSFQVHRIDTFYGRQLASSLLHTGSSSSASSRLKGSPIPPKVLIPQSSQFRTSAILSLPPAGSSVPPAATSEVLADATTPKPSVDDDHTKTPLSTATSAAKLSGPIKPSRVSTSASRALFDPPFPDEQGGAVLPESGITTPDEPGTQGATAISDAASDKRSLDEGGSDPPLTKNPRRNSQGKKGKQ